MNATLQEIIQHPGSQYFALYRSSARPTEQENPQTKESPTKLKSPNHSAEENRVTDWVHPTFTQIEADQGKLEDFYKCIFFFCTADFENENETFSDFVLVYQISLDSGTTT